MSKLCDYREFSIVCDDRHVTPSLHLCTCNNCPGRTIHVHRWSDGVTIVTYNRKLPIISRCDSSCHRRMAHGAEGGGGGGYQVKMSELIMSEVKMSAVKMSEVIMPEVKMSGVKMSEVIMSEVKMSGVKMSEVKMSEVIISEVKMSEVKMSEVIMAEVKMSEVIMSEVKTGADPGFSFGWGQKIMCPHAHTSAEPNSLSAGVQGPGSPGLF